jgi:hypothetical protein
MKKKHPHSEIILSQAKKSIPSKQPHKQILLPPSFIPCLLENSHICYIILGYVIIQAT